MQARDEQIKATSGFLQGSLGPDILTKDNGRITNRLKRLFRNSKRPSHKQKRSKNKGHVHAR